MEKEKIILHVEDDDGNAYLIKRNLKANGLLSEVIRFEHGETFFEYLNNQNNFEKFIIILDIKLPLYDGLTILKMLKSDTAKKTIPVFMLTTTDNPQDIERAYELGCIKYFTKPANYIEIIEAINKLTIKIDYYGISKQFIL